MDERGCIVPAEFEKLVNKSKSRGETPFFLNATAGTTVHGSFDPFTELSAICKKEGLWMHIDGSWGGSVVFNAHYASSRLAGADLADSITINPHKMLGVPMTCSFLLGRDMNTFYKALTLPAGKHTASPYYFPSLLLSINSVLRTTKATSSTTPLAQPWKISTTSQT